MRTFAIVAVLLALSGVANAQSAVSVAGDHENVVGEEAAAVVTRYERLVDAVHQPIREDARLKDVLNYFEPDVVPAITELYEDNESFFARCGDLDLISCFDKEYQRPSNVTFREQEGIRAACITYAQRTADGGLIGLVYMVPRDHEWYLLGITRKEYDAPSYEEVTEDPSEECWRG